MRSLMEYGSLIVDKIGSKLICFGLNKITLFTKLQTSVAIQFKSKVAPLVTSMNCMHIKLTLQCKLFLRSP
jgi:hypothetical protein